MEALTARERECWRMGWPTITATEPGVGETDWAVGAVAGDPVDQRGGDTRSGLPRIVAADRRPAPHSADHGPALHSAWDDRVATVIVVRGTSELTAADAIEWVIARFGFASWRTFDSLGDDEEYVWWYSIKLPIPAESELARLIRPRHMTLRPARPDGSPEPPEWIDLADRIFLENATFRFGSTVFDLKSLRQGLAQWEMLARTVSVTVNVLARDEEEAEERAVAFVARLPSRSS